MICRLCLTETEIYLPLKNAETQVQDEELEDIVGIIGKHFDLSLDVNSDLVCTVCWQQITDFHLFYLFIEEKQKELSQQSQLPVFTSSIKIEPKPAGNEYEHEKILKDAAKDEMRLKNESIIDIQNTTITPENTAGECNKGENPQEATEDLEDMKNVELIDQCDITNAFLAKMDYEHDVEMRDEDGDDVEVDIKNESTIEISAPMITEHNSQWNKVVKQEETENHKVAQNVDLADIVNDQQSRDATNVNEASSDVAVSAVTRKKTSKKQRISNNAEDVCIFKRENFENLMQRFDGQHNSKGYVRCCNKKYFCRQYYADHLEWHLNPSLWRCFYSREPCGDSLFTCRVSYEVHLSTVHHVIENLNWKCKICPVKFSEEYLLHQHGRECHFKCDECNKVFKSTQGRNSHKKSVHQRRYSVTCDICGINCASPTVLKIHKGNIHNIQKIKCDECEKEFKHVAYLNLHKKEVHQGARTVKCAYCEKEFKFLNNLRIHHRSVHLRVKQTQCDICGKYLHSELQCKMHKSTAHKSNPLNFECTHCPQKFAYKFQLNRHVMRKHSGQNIKCDECEKVFKHVTYLKVHKKQFHPVAGHFQCPHCSKKFISQSQLNRHAREVHSDKKFKCENCQKEYKSLSSLKHHNKIVHLRVYNTECDICGKNFGTLARCQFHKANVHQVSEYMDFQCPHCPQKFLFKYLLHAHIIDNHSE